MNIANQTIPAQQESALLDFVARIRKSTAGRNAIHVHMSALQPTNRHPSRLRIAALAFEPLVIGFEGTVFHLRNADFVVFCKGAPPETVKRAILHIQNLFIDDPAIKDAGPDQMSFCTHFDVHREYKLVLALSEQAFESARQHHDALGGVSSQDTARPPQRALDPKMLGRIQSAISQADLTNVIRRQMVCALVSGQAPQPVFTEVFTSIAALREVISPEIDISKNPWLFQDLATYLDRRVISFLAHKDDSSLHQAFSLNLNVCSLASPEFLSLDREMSGEARRSVVVELQLIDILAGLDDFLFARNFLRERRYRFCLDGMTHQSLPMINFKHLDVDLVKVIWSPALHQEAMRKDSAVHEAIAAIEAKRVILIRCDDELAIETGQALGVSMFQGFLIDKMAKARRPVKLASG